MIKVSIIIPLYVITPRFFEDLKKFEKLKYKNYEIIVVCDKKVKVKQKNTRFIHTKRDKTGPAEKRDIALKAAKGEICAFIDDDAYPHPLWLTNALKEFKNPQIAAVGGPGITPEEDNYWEQLTGLVYESIFCSGLAQYRFKKGKRQFVVDYPAYNLLVRKSVMKKVGGYGSNFYGGEDTFLCLKIIQAGYKIIYDPEVVVYHHRRALFMPYLKQISNVGKHRGYFAKAFPETSRYIWYFIPATLALGFFVMFIGSLFSFFIAVTFLSGLVFFLALGFFSVIKKTSPVSALFVSFGIVLTHIFYGLAFIKGLIIPSLDR